MTGGTIGAVSGGFIQFFSNGYGACNVNVLSSTATAYIPSRLDLRQSPNVTFTVSGGTTASGIDLLVGGAITQTTANSGFTLAGGGVMALTSTGSSYTGVTAISGGTLLLGTGGATGSLGSGGGGVTDNSVLAFNRSDSGLAVPNAISGGGSVAQIGTGLTLLSGANSYSGGTSLTAGTLQLGSATALGTGAVTINGGSVLDIHGINAAAGGVNLVNGTIINAVGATTLSGTAYNVQSGSVSAILAGGTAALNMTGSGLVTLAAANTYGGGTTVSSGTLQLGDGAVNNGAVTGNITNNSTLVFANPNVQQYAGAVSGTGNLRKTAAGILTLSGNSTYNGATNVNAGTLLLTGSLASPSVTVANGAALSGAGNGTTTGLIAGTVTLNGGGAIDFTKNGLAAGATTTLVFNGLTLGDSTTAANLTFNVNAGNSQTSDLINSGRRHAHGEPGRRRGQPQHHVAGRGQLRPDQLRRPGWRRHDLAQSQRGPRGTLHAVAGKHEQQLAIERVGQSHAPAGLLVRELCRAAGRQLQLGRIQRFHDHYQLVCGPIRRNRHGPDRGRRLGRGLRRHDGLRPRRQFHVGRRVQRQQLDGDHRGRRFHRRQPDAHDQCRGQRRRRLRLFRRQRHRDAARRGPADDWRDHRGSGRQPKLDEQFQQFDDRLQQRDGRGHARQYHDLDPGRFRHGRRPAFGNDQRRHERREPGAGGQCAQRPVHAGGQQYLFGRHDRQRRHAGRFDQQFFGHRRGDHESIFRHGRAGPHQQLAQPARAFQQRRGARSWSWATRPAADRRRP